MAYRLGFPSAQRFLDSITTAEWFEWVAWSRIVGPLGPEREDFYVKFIAAFARGPDAEGKAIPMSSLRMPWESDPDVEKAMTPVKPEDRRPGPFFLTREQRRRAGV